MPGGVRVGVASFAEESSSTWERGVEPGKGVGVGWSTWKSGAVPRSEFDYIEEGVSSRGVRMPDCRIGVARKVFMGLACTIGKHLMEVGVH